MSVRRDPIPMLILDDEAERDALLTGRYLEEDAAFTFTIVRDADAAIAALEASYIPCISLDHDLGTGVSTTGMHVVEHIVRMAHGCRPHIVWIHSMDRVASRTMHRALREAGVVSYWWPYKPLPRSS